MTTGKKCTCGDEEVHPVDKWTDACEEAIREVEKVNVEQQGDMCVKQAAKLLSLAIKLHYGEEEPTKITEGPTKVLKKPRATPIDTHELARLFLSLPYRHQHAIIEHLGVFTEDEIECLRGHLQRGDIQIHQELFKRASKKGLLEELWQEVQKYSP
jgi:hypothetical protein